MSRFDKVLGEILKNESDCNMIIQTSYLFKKESQNGSIAKSRIEQGKQKAEVICGSCDIFTV